MRLRPHRLLPWAFGLLVFCPSLLPAQTWTAPRVPETVTWCGVALDLNADARKRVQEYVDRLYVKPAYFEALATKAAIFLPHIRHGLREAGVPDDLQYVVIQESGLQGDAVSTSQAVGFWQFKDFTAREVGLVVDEHIDERKHISRATAGAARYFYKNNLWFNNWVYATIAYMTGPTGALSYVDPAYYGAQRMPADASLHWYAIKSIAYKVAFEPALDRIQPPIQLEAHTAGTDLQLAALCKTHDLTAAEFRAYNLWFQGWRVRSQRPLTYFVPRKTGRTEPPTDPHLATLFPRLDPHPTFAYAQPIPRAPQPASPAATDRTAVATTPPRPSARKQAGPRPLSEEPLLDREFTYVRAGETLPLLALRTQVKIARLVRWNDLGHGETLVEGTPVLLVPPRKAQVHIALGKETLAQVANWYEQPVERLAAYNDLPEVNRLLPRGRKLYLQAAAPTGSEPVIYQLDPPKPVPAATQEPEALASAASPTPAIERAVVPARPQPTTAPKPGPTKSVAGPAQPAVTPSSGSPAEAAAPAETRGVYQLYRVSRGDTLYSIARRFGMSLDELRQVNGLDSESLPVGTSLLVRSES